MQSIWHRHRARIAMISLFTCGCLLMMAMAVYSTRANSLEQSDTEQPIASAKLNVARLSTVSCRGCHGSESFVTPAIPADRWKSAYQIWLSEDPHSRAYTTLWNDLSRQMVAALAGQDFAAVAGEPLSDDDHQAILNDRCVSCHSSVPPDMSMEMLTKQGQTSDGNLFMATGVNCHSCHSADDLENASGNSWIELHTLKSWEDPGRDKSAAGLQDIANLTVRSQTCGECHIGSVGRVVNHDLIAAGHPRLVFEYSSHLHRLPKHWTEAANNNFHVDCWLIGRKLATQQAILLLKKRAENAGKGHGPWPEFSEYNCHDCHHAIGGHWNLKNELGKFGRPAWETWAFPKHSPYFASTSEFRTEMERPAPDPVIVAAKIAEYAGDPERFQFQPSLDHLFLYLKSNPQPNSDEILAWYLAVQSYLRDVNDQNPEKIAVEPLMAKLWNELKQGEIDDQKVGDLISLIRQSLF